MANNWMVLFIQAETSHAALWKQNNNKNYITCVAASPSPNTFLYTFWQVPHRAPACLDEPEMCTTQSLPQSVGRSCSKEYSSQDI